MLFLLISVFSFSWKGFFGTLIRLIILLAKIYETIPIFGGSLKIHKYLIEDGKALQFQNCAIETAKPKICKGGKCLSPQVLQNASGNECIAETLEEESPAQRETIGH